MRARNIKPGFFKNDTLAELDFAGRLLFIGLWGIADRAGRLEDRQKKIKAELFPYDEVNVDSFLGELTRLGFILRYEVEGEGVKHILKSDAALIVAARNSLPAILTEIRELRAENARLREVLKTADKLLWDEGYTVTEPVVQKIAQALGEPQCP